MSSDWFPNFSGIQTQPVEGLCERRWPTGHLSISDSDRNGELLLLAHSQDTQGKRLLNLSE